MEDTPTSTETASYLATIVQYEKAARKWQERGKKILKRYRDERPEGVTSGQFRYNILWSNVETLKPAIYAKSPTPVVERRFKDKDPVGRQASDVLERCISYFTASTPFGSTMRQVRDDYLLPGRGVAWVRYVPTMQDMPSDGQVTEDVAQEVTFEDVTSDYVHWQDFGHNVARVWEEVGIVWRIVYMTRKQMKKRGFEAWNDVPLDFRDRDDDGRFSSAGEENRKACIYEIWDKTKRKVYWLSKAYPKYLDVKADPLKLDYFFPCSRPVYATLTNDTLIPVPDYAEYQDQAEEIDQITQRIAMLQKCIKAAGVYDQSIPALARMLSEGVQNTLIPVDGWAALAEKGGIKGAVELLPMQEVAETLLMLYEAREKVKQDLYEITGMSDIVRGANNPNSTATAERLKSNFVTLRLSEKQREMQRFARNTIEIIGNIIALHFSMETIRRISGVKMLTEAEKQQVQQRMAMQQQAQQLAQQGQQVPQLPPIPDEIMEMMKEPSWDQVYALLQDTPERSFRIEIETDSTIDMDDEAEKEQAMQFLQAVGGFINQAQEAGSNPVMLPLLAEMLSFGVRRWRVGRQLESVIDETMEKLQKIAAEPKQAPPDPAMVKVQQDGEIAKAKLKQDFDLAQMKMDNDHKLALQKLANDKYLETMKAIASAHMQAGQSGIDQMNADNDAARERENHMREDDTERWKAEKDAETKIEVAEITAGATIDAAQVKAAKDASK